VVLAAAIAAPFWARAHGDSLPARCAGFEQESVQRAALVTGKGTGTLVVGDSYSVGHLLTPRQSWPVRLPGRVHVAGFSGSGFAATDSPCGLESYADRAPAALRPGIRRVVVEGGLNDFDQHDGAIAAGFHRLMTELKGRRVLVVGPPPAPSRVAEVPRLDALLARLSAGAHVQYLSMAHARLDYLPDRLHPTAGSQRAFGDLVAAALDHDSGSHH